MEGVSHNIDNVGPRTCCYYCMFTGCGQHWLHVESPAPLSACTCVCVCARARARVPEADERERVISEVTGHTGCRMAGPPNALVPFVLRAELFSSAACSESAGRRARAADQFASGGSAAHVLQRVQRLRPCPPEPDERRQPESYSTCFFFSPPPR